MQIRSESFLLDRYVSACGFHEGQLLFSSGTASRLLKQRIVGEKTHYSSAAAQSLDTAKPVFYYITPAL